MIYNYRKTSLWHCLWHCHKWMQPSFRSLLFDVQWLPHELHRLRKHFAAWPPSLIFTIQSALQNGCKWMNMLWGKVKKLAIAKIWENA